MLGVGARGAVRVWLCIAARYCCEDGNYFFSAASVFCFGFVFWWMCFSLSLFLSFSLSLSFWLVCVCGSRVERCVQASDPLCGSVCVGSRGRVMACLHACLASS